MPMFCAGYKSLARRGGGDSQPADPQHGHGGRRPVPAPPLLVLPAGLRAAGPTKDGKPLVPDGENKYHAHLRRRSGIFREPVEPWAGAWWRWRQGEMVFGEGRAPARLRWARFFVATKDENTREIALLPNEISPRS